jgi:hypothetical protein
MDETPIVRTCPQCGQPLAPGVESCANCGRDEANPFTSPAAPLDEPAPRGSSLQLLFAVVTVICVSLAIGVLLPGVGGGFYDRLLPLGLAVFRYRDRRRHRNDPWLRLGRFGWLGRILLVYEKILAAVDGRRR